jgi:PBP1b-binding outer membrane lipoprotein LpoB
MLKIVSIVLLSSLFFTGCSTLSPKEEWLTPPYPQMKDVKFVLSDEVKNPTDGFYIDSKSAVNLANNIDELKAYSKKLEVLVAEMKKYYNAK